jgi:hypothetical protein
MQGTKRPSLDGIRTGLFLSFFICAMPLTVLGQRTEPLVVDHGSTDITMIPEWEIQAAKATLHIAYGHTSHGSQLTSGMTGLVGFANGGGLGLSLPQDIFAWNSGGTGGALDLRDGVMAGDVGYYPQWVDETRDYLGAPDPATGRGTNEPDVNVIVWAWCYQVPAKYVAGTLGSEYLYPMTQLELDYPGVVFVYMTGHVNHAKDAATTAGNQVIRDYCIANNKVLYDFEDIECWDPDWTFFEYPNDNCDYYDGPPTEGVLLGNWAIEWQDSHTEGVYWYDCLSAHSQPLNANRKAYAAWWMWATLAGWNAPPTAVPDHGSEPARPELHQNTPNPFNPITRIDYSIATRTGVVLRIYDVRGREIATLVDETVPRGTYHAYWDGRDGEGLPVVSGVYFYRLVAGEFTAVKKMVLLR